jgi:transcription elongation GreA/GreB family factor
MNLETNQSEAFTILGAWDSDPDKGIISYLTPVGQSLLNHKVGDEVEFELHGAKRRHRIEKIDMWKTEAIATPPPAPFEMLARV